jgi:S-adenosylmethionine synthetase
MAFEDPISETAQMINIVDELLGTIKTYEMICDKILKKGALNVRDEMDYNRAIAIIEQCDKELEEIGYYEGEY